MRATLLLFFLSAACFAVDTVGGTPEESMAPAKQPTHTKPVQTEGFIPKAQQGIQPSQAQVSLSVTADETNPEFHPDKLKVKAGQIVKLTFTNPSKVDAQHSWFLVQPGQERKVGLAALKTGPDNGYVPNLPDAIIAHTRILNPGESETIYFRAPDKPGDYPYICTFPGHWEGMRGTLKVEKK